LYQITAASRNLDLWVGSYCPQIPVLYTLSSNEFVEPPTLLNKIPGYTTGPNSFTPGIVLLVLTEEDDRRDAELVWIHAKEKSLQLVKGVNPDSSISQLVT